MKKLVMLLAAGILFLSSLNAQNGLLPNAGERLDAYKTRMEAYFAPQIANRGLDALVQDEGSEYNEYRRFLRYWEPRLYPHGDFAHYFQLQQNFYQGGGGGGTMRAPGNTDPWQEIGPIEKPLTNFGAEGTGPTEFISFYPGAPNRMLCGSVVGGLFYSTNSGVNWSRTGTDTKIFRSGVSSAVFHPSNHQIWFAASGSDAGWMGTTGGIFRTTDSGVNWTQIGTQAQVGGIWTKIFKILINPANANQLWVATSWGMYVTNNALAAAPSWTSVSTFANKNLYDLEMRPGNPNYMYTTCADWSGSSLINWRYMYSTDNGSTWSNVPGMPAYVSTSKWLTIEVSPADADNLYCLSTSSGGTGTLDIYDFGGNTWTTVSPTTSISMGGGHSFGVDPFDPNEIFVSNGTEGRRYNYSGSWTFFQYNSTYYGGTYHPDIEDLVPHPVTANEVWMCHHGGVAFSTNNGNTWIDRSNGIGTAQVIRMAHSASNPSYVAAGLYHDGSIITNSSWYNNWSPSWRAFPNAYCDGIMPMIDPLDPNYMWTSCQWGAWHKSTDAGVTSSSNPPSSPSWIVESAFNNLDPKIQYRLSTDVNGKHTIKRTFDRGVTWAQIADFAALWPAASYDYILWSVYTSETNGDYLITHLLEKPASANVNWTHHLYRTKFANDPVAGNVIASWEELPVPDNRWISDVEYDPVNPNIVYISNSSSSASALVSTGTEMVFKVDYTTPSLHTYDVCTSGLCWDLTQNLPNATTGHASLEYERGSNGGMYYACDFGCWYSNTASRLGGSGWVQLGTALPNVGYNGLEINYVNNKIRAGSFGRGMWEHDLFCPGIVNKVESGTYSADLFLEVQQWITSTATVPSPRDVTYRAGTYIDLQPGFNAQYGSKFLAFIHPCDAPGNSPLRIPDVSMEEGGVAVIENEEDAGTVASDIHTPLNSTPAEVRLFPNPNNGVFMIALPGLAETELWNLVVTDLNGKTILQAQNLTGMQRFQLPEGTASGIYFARISFRDQHITRKIQLF